jgi:hypothetical protein
VPALASQSVASRENEKSEKVVIKNPNQEILIRIIGESCENENFYPEIFDTASNIAFIFGVFSCVKNHFSLVAAMNLLILSHTVSGHSIRVLY